MPMRLIASNACHARAYWSRNSSSYTSQRNTAALAGIEASAKIARKLRKFAISSQIASAIFSENALGLTVVIKFGQKNTRHPAT
jgi:hypothetical protein